MGANESSLGKHTTAKEVVEHFGKGKWLEGKTAVITGGNSGIGLEGCKALANAGCKVVMCSRSVKNAEQAIETELMQDGEGHYSLSAEDRKLVSVRQLDLNSMASVRAFTDEILKSKLEIDFLILNAGIMAVQTRQETEEGFEKQIGVNHFGHAYLVQRLYASLTSSAKRRKADCRVVVLSSSAHANMMGIVPDIEVGGDLHFEKQKYAPWPAYGRSKLANLLFAKGLEKKFRDDGFGDFCTAMAVHPGVIKTALWKETSFSTNPVMSWIGNVFLMGKTIPQGAATTLFATLAPEAKGAQYRGAYLADCALASESENAKDASKRDYLWDVTEKQLVEKETKSKSKN